ncbi:MAG: ABC transporter ATP-binding protein, partial [Gemmatimonadota bacterium]
MYVRLAFAVAAHLEPEILVVDEVLAVGDAEFQKKCLGKMEQAGKEGRTVLFVSHNLAAVKALCGRAILLAGGRVRYDGDVLAAVSRYTGREEAGVAVVRWAGEDAPALPSCRLREAGILSAGERAGTELSTERPIQVYVRFRVARPAVVGTSVILSNGDGQYLFSSISNHEPRWHGRERPAGDYRSECEIPPNYLAGGDYSVSIGLWEGPYKAGLVEKDALRFTAHAGGLVKGDLPDEIRGVLTLPLLAWRSEREGDDAGEDRA